MSANGAAAPYAVTAIVAALLVVVGYAIVVSGPAATESDASLSLDSRTLSVGRADVGRDSVLWSSGAAVVRGDVQRIKIDASTAAGLTPNHVVLRAGVPAEVRFSRGHDGLGVVRVARIGLTVDVEAGPTTVRVPPLEPGVYPITAGPGSAAGLIVVE